MQRINSEIQSTKKKELDKQGDGDIFFTHSTPPFMTIVLRGMTLEISVMRDNPANLPTVCRVETTGIGV